MRRIATALLVGAGIMAAASAPALAQEDEGAFWKVTTYKVPPPFAENFSDAVEKAVEAAKLAELGPEWGWMVYTENSNFHVVTRHESLADLDDDEAWSRQFAGTAGEATLQEAFGMFQEVHGYTVESHITRSLPAWSYEPAEMAFGEDGPEGVMLYRSHVMPGNMEAYGENTVALMDVFREMNYPYAVWANRIVVGDETMVYYVMPYDDLSKVYGENSIMSWLEKTGMGEKWGALFDERRPMQMSTDSFSMSYASELSYWPEQEM
jgi:hypothetical protein